MKEILESLGLGDAVVAKFRDENVSHAACDIARILILMTQSMGLRLGKDFISMQ